MPICTGFAHLLLPYSVYDVLQVFYCYLYAPCELPKVVITAMCYCQNVYFVQEFFKLQTKLM